MYTAVEDRHHITNPFFEKSSTHFEKPQLCINVEQNDQPQCLGFYDKKKVMLTSLQNHLIGSHLS